MQESGSLAVFKVTARDQGHYKGPLGAFVTYCNISCCCFFLFLIIYDFFLSLFFEGGGSGENAVSEHETQCWLVGCFGFNGI